MNQNTKMFQLLSGRTYVKRSEEWMEERPSFFQKQITSNTLTSAWRKPKMANKQYNVKSSNCPGCNNKLRRWWPPPPSRHCSSIPTYSVVDIAKVSNSSVITCVIRGEIVIGSVGCIDGHTDQLARAKQWWVRGLATFVAPPTNLHPPINSPDHVYQQSIYIYIFFFFELNSRRGSCQARQLH